MHNSKLLTWPPERDLEKYTKYTHIDFDKDLSDGKTWIDIGCRTGLAMNETRKKCQARLVGINAHPIKVLDGIESIYATIPHDQSVYKKFKNSVDLLTDIYGAVSYENDPLAVMIYEALLLKHHGKAVMVSLEAKIGNRANHQDMKHFFKSVMGQELEFTRFRHYSYNLKRAVNTLRMTIRGGSTSKLSYEALLEKAKELVGIPKKGKILFSTTDQKGDIVKIVYKNS